MAITGLDELIDAMANRSQGVVVNKTALANTAIGLTYSMWRASGIPGAGTIPTAFEVCSATTFGGLAVTPATSGQLYMARAFMLTSLSLTDVQVHDRLVQMGGLSGTVLTAQTVGASLVSTTSNLDTRIGQSDFSDVQWWIEWYADTGTTARTFTAAVTYQDDTTDNIAVAAAVSTRAGRMMPIFPAVGKNIKAVNSITLSGTTGTAGNFGVTATRIRTGFSIAIGNAGLLADWAMLGLPRIMANSCLQLVVIPGSGSSGTIYGTMKIVEG